MTIKEALNNVGKALQDLAQAYINRAKEHLDNNDPQSAMNAMHSAQCAQKAADNYI